MVEPTRLTILKKLTEHLAGISTVDGYNFDLNGAVFRGRTIFGENDPLPMVSILESSRSESTYSTNDFDQRQDKWSLLLQGWVADDINNPTDPAYFLADDVFNRLNMLVAIKNDSSGRALYPDTYLLGGLIGGIEFGQPIIRPPIEQVSSKAFFYIPVTLTLAT